MARFAPLAFALLAACALLVRGDDEGPWLELLSGAKDGNMKLTTQAIEQGADIDRIDQYGDTALLIACENSHEEVAEFLIEKGANIEARNNHSSTVIMRAAMKGEADVVSLLIKKGANVNAVNKAGISGLSFAHSHSHIHGQNNMIQELIDAGAKRGDMKNRAGLHEMVCALLRAAPLRSILHTRRASAPPPLRCQPSRKPLAELSTVFCACRTGTSCGAWSRKSSAVQALCCCAGRTRRRRRRRACGLWQ